MTALLSLALAATVSATDPYVRTRTDSGDVATPTGPFLYWGQNTITYVQDAYGNPDNEGPSEFTAVSASFHSWQQELTACGGLTLVEGPRVNSRKATFSDDLKGNQNLVLFRDKDCRKEVPSADECWEDGDCYNKHDCWGYRAETIALTTTTFNSKTGQILDADIELNAAWFMFTTVESPACSRSGPFSQQCVATDIQNTMTHEVGHLLGLDHTDAPGSTMNTTAPVGETAKRSLDPGTISFLCEVYPPGTQVTVQKMDAPVGKDLGCSSISGLLTPLAAVVWGMSLRRRRRGHS